MENAPTETEILTDYTVENLIHKIITFPPYLWAESPSYNPRITNGPEAFHCDYNSHFYTSNPNCFMVINIVLEFHEAYLKICIVLNVML